MVKMGSTSAAAPSWRATLLGVLAVVLWGTAIACSRSLSEKLGTLTAPTVLFAVAGALGLLPVLLDGGRRRALVRLPWRYVLGCGTLFVVYMVGLYGAIGLAADRQQLLLVTLINYLWPGLTLLLSLPLCGQRPVWALLAPGLTFAFAGVALALAGPEWRALLAAPTALGRAVLVPWGLALLAAVAWALYSNLSRRWGRGAEAGAVPLFLLASAAVFGVARYYYPENSAWTREAWGEIAFIAVFPTLLAYSFWDIAMRRGHLPLIAALANAIPLLSIGVAYLYLGVKPATTVWTAGALIVLGSAMARAGVVEGIAARAQP